VGCGTHESRVGSEQAVLGESRSVRKERTEVNGIPFDCPVWIAGPDHHSTLSLVRCFGRAGADVRLLLCGTAGETATGRSRYAKRAEVIRPGNLVRRLLQIGSRSVTRSFLIPADDRTMYEIDRNAILLCSDFYIPGFQGQSGVTAFLMDKLNQNSFVLRNGIPAARSESVGLPLAFPPGWSVYPCVVKPRISVYGSKADIAVCRNPDELVSALARYAEKGYPGALIQEYVVKTRELCAFGCVTGDPANAVTAVVEKIRQWPPGGGATSCARTIDEETVNRFVARITDTLRNYGYRGLFDIEIFDTPDGLVLNEINFRQSGNGYALNRFGVYAPLYWCLDAVGLRRPDWMKTAVPAGHRIVNEMTEYEHLRRNRRKFPALLRDMIVASAHAAFDLKDLPGTAARYREMFRSR
jgi:D-aspartate ligase